MENVKLTVIYSHGRFGSPWHGLKIEALRPVALKLGINIIAVRYPEPMSADEMVGKLVDVCKNDENIPGDLILLGSSMGGYVSVKAAQIIDEIYKGQGSGMEGDKMVPPRNVIGVFLIAPALYIKPEFYPDQDPQLLDVPTVIVHGYDDDVIDYKNSVRFAEKFKAQLHLVKGGHRLNSQIPNLCLFFENFLKERFEFSRNLYLDWMKNNNAYFTQED